MSISSSSAFTSVIFCSGRQLNFQGTPSGLTRMFAFRCLCNSQLTGMCPVRAALSLNFFYLRVRSLSFIFIGGGNTECGGEGAGRLSPSTLPTGHLACTALGTVVAKAKLPCFSSCGWWGGPTAREAYPWSFRRPRSVLYVAEMGLGCRTS
jgi:hypothetical protein